ncbi:MAG: methyl-accepting chemotaxis protein [Oscillospiraceae bacterium]
MNAREKADAKLHQVKIKADDRIKKVRKRMGLTKRMMLMCLVPMVCLAVIMAMAACIMQYINISACYEDEAVALARSYSAATVRFVDQLEEDLGMVAADSDIVDDSIPMEERKAMLSELAALSTFKDFSVARADGTTYNDTDLSEREYFRYALDNRSSYVSSPVIRMTDNSVTIMMGRYFTVGGQSYVAYGGLDSGLFNNVISDVHFGDNGICFVLDKTGEVIATSSDIVPMMAMADGSEQNGLENLAPVAAAMTAGETGKMIANINGTDYYIGYAPVEGNESWSIAVATPYGPLKRTIIVSFCQLAVYLIVCIAIVIPIIIRLIRRISKPVVESAKRLEAFAEGDISSPTPECDSGDEIQLITDSLRYMVKNIGGYIGDIHMVIKGVSEGDLTVTTNADYKGDFVRIKTSLNMILDSLNGFMTEVGRSASEVREGAGQLAEGSTSLSQNAITQASAVDEITSTVMSIAEKTDANNNNVVRALGATTDANERAKDGTRSMNDLLDAIAEIERSSEEIKNIIKVIDDIAFQTNILALNAAIEAARAGEAGKGFAVVADEVRNLASKSSEAAQQTGQLIGRSIETVNRGTELAKEASAAIDGIVQVVDDVAKVMNEISQASAEQKLAVDQISAGMENVNAAIHNTTATAEESAAASEELSALAVSLSDEVGRFRVR